MPFRFAVICCAATIALTVTTVAGQAKIPGAADDVQRVVARARDAYANLTAWHFEHTIAIDEIAPSGKPANIAQVSLNTAVQGATAARVILASNVCAGRCRMESRTAQTSVMVLGDGKETWMYSPTRQEYMKGESLRDVTTSVSGSMLLALHLTPLTSLGLDKAAYADTYEEGWSGARLLPDEVIEIGGQRRSCYVVEATLKSTGLPLDRIGPTAPSPSGAAPFATPSGYFMLLQIAGGVAQAGGAGGVSSMYVAPPPGTEPVVVRLWIDKERSLVVRRTVLERAIKLAAPARPTDQPEQTAVQLQLTDTFTSVNTGSAVRDALFVFQPAVGDREISNIRKPR